MTGRPATRELRALGTTLVVAVDDPDRLEAATAAAVEQIDAVDQACSRFRDDSELSRLVARPAVETSISSLLADALTTAFAAAEATDGLVDQTVAAALRAWGYDRDFSAMPAGMAPMTLTVEAVPGWRSIRFDRDARTVVVPVDVELDLGATAKGFAADRAALAAGAAAGCPTLVSIGGDIAVGGPERRDGWDIRITDDHATGPEADGPVVSLSSGGLATSSTTVRRWRRGAVSAHHVIDPRTGRPAEVWWRTASVTAASCAEANCASTAAIVLGLEAQSWLDERGLPARLVHVGGSVTYVAGWPCDETAPVT